MNLSTRIIVKTHFVGIHCWPECPHEEVKFLRSPHRHVFHVTVKAPVKHNDRHLEFFVVKNKLNEFLAKYPEDLGSMSCEMLCQDIISKFPEFTYVCVMEDNENGAEIERYRH